jgi:putative transposase
VQLGVGLPDESSEGAGLGGEFLDTVESRGLDLGSRDPPPTLLPVILVQSRALDHWAYQGGVKLDFSRPGKPTDNAHIEAFNGRFRQECLSQHWFLDLNDARRVVEAWREDYNNHRPHGALNRQIPVEYLAGRTYEPDRRRLQKLRV